MKFLCEITDKDILGQDGLSTAAPRYTARAIVKNTVGEYAVMYSHKFNLHTLPGGGIEKNEDIIEALKREILEETGCSCDLITELGYVSENRAHCDYTQISYYFIVETKSGYETPELTEAEINNRTEVQWHSLEKMADLIINAEHDTTQRKFLQARDVAAINEYMKLQSK